MIRRSRISVRPNVRPNPSAAGRSGPQPASQDAPGPQPVSQDAPGPQSVSQDAPGPQPVSQDAPGSQPSSQDAPASLETPQLSQEARSEINEDHSVAVVTERSMASPLRKSTVPRDTGDAGGEAGTSSSAALQRRKRFAVKPKVAPALNRARAPKSPVRPVVLDSPVVEGADGENVTASSQTDATLSQGTMSQSQQQTLSGGVTGGDERPTTPVVPTADDDPTERAQVPLEKSQPLEPSPNSQAKDVPPKPPDKPCLSDKEAMEISERAKTLVSKATKGGLIPPQAQLTLSRLLNDTSDLQRLEKARKLRELLKKEINKDKVKKNMKNTTAKTRIKEYTPDTAKMTMRDLIYYLPVSNPMSSYLADSQGKNENEIVVPPSPARQQSPERAPSPAPSSRHEDDDGDDEQEENNEADEDQMMVPRVKVAEDGSLIIDEESLTVEVKRAKGPNPADGSDPIFERGSTTTYSSFRKGNYTKPWTTEETEMFFLAISMVGTDFSMICQLFPHRARSQIKHKFKREERDNSWRIDKAFKEKRKMDIEFFSKLLEKILEVQKCKKPKSREKKTKSPSEEKTTRKRSKKTKGKKAEKKLSDVEEEEEEDGGADMEEVEGEKENEDVSNERGTPASPQRKRKRKKKDDGEATEEPSEEKKQKKKKKKDEKQTDEQVEACLPEAGDAALPEDQSAVDSSGKTESLAAAKSAVIKPAQLSRGRAPKPLVPLGRKWGKKGQAPSTKDPDVGGKSPADDKVDEESSPLRPTKEHRQDADSSCEEEHSTASPPKPTRYGRLPKPVQHLNYSAKEDALSSASDEPTPGSASKPKRLVKKAAPSKAKSRPKKPQLVTLRASQSEGSDDDGDNDHGLSEPEDMDPQHHSSSPHKDSSAPVFVPVGLRSPQPVVSVVEETMEELDISVNVPDVLGMARDALCSDASCERAQDNTGTVPCDHQLDLLVDVIDFMSSDHVEVSSDESYNEAAQTLLTIGTVAHHSQLAQTPTSPQSHTAGAPFNSGNETSSHALEEELATETVTHIQSSGSPLAALPSSPVSTDPSQPTDSDVPDTNVIDSCSRIGDRINEKMGEGTHSSQKTNADVETETVVDVSQEMLEQNSSPAKRRRLPKAKPKPNLGRAARFAQSKSDQIEETATEAVALIQSSATPVAAVPSGPASTESSQTTDMDEPSVTVPSELSKVSESSVSDIVPASLAEYTPSSQTALGEETSVSQTNSADVGPGLQKELGTDILEQHSPHNRESGFSYVEHKPILGEATRKAIPKCDSHSTEQTLRSTENSCTAHAQDETTTSDIAASDAQHETKTIAAPELQVIKESPALDSVLVQDTCDHHTTNADVEAAYVVDVCQEMPEQNSPPAKRRRLPKAKPKPNLGRAARFAQSKSNQIEETATEAVALIQSSATPVAAVPSGPVSTESSQTADVGEPSVTVPSELSEVSASSVSDIVPASLAEHTPSTDMALSEETSVSQTNSADVGPGLQLELDTDIWERHSPQNKESGFSNVEHEPILGEATRNAVTKSDSHSTEQTLTSTENSCTAHAQDETITSDIVATDAQDETRSIAATELQVIKESPALDSVLVHDTSDHHTTNADVEAAPVVDVSQEMPVQNSPAKRRRLPKAKPKPNLGRAARFAQSKSNQIEETATEAVALIQSSITPVAAVPSGPVSTESSQTTEVDEPSVTVPSELSKVSASTVSDIVPASSAEYTPSTETVLSEETSVSQRNSADVVPGLQKELGTDISEQYSPQNKESGFSNVEHEPILGEATRKAITKSDSHSTEQTSTENSCTAHAQDETITSDIVASDAQDETRTIAATELQVIKESPTLESILVQDTSDHHTTNADVEAAPVVDVCQEMPVQNSPPAKRQRLPKAKPKPNLGRAARFSQSKSNQIEEMATEAVALIQSSAAPVAAVPSGPVSTESSQTADVGEPSVTVPSELSKVSASAVSDIVPASLAEYTPSTETALSEETSVSQTNSADVGPGLQLELGTDISEQHSPQNKESGFSNVEHEPILGEANRKAVTNPDSHSTEQTLRSTENSCTAHAQAETITSDIAASDAQNETKTIAATELQVIKESPALESILVQDTSDHHTTNADVEASPVVDVSQEMPEQNSPAKRRRLPKAKPKPNLGRAARFAQSKSNQIEETATEAVALIQSSDHAQDETITSDIAASDAQDETRSIAATELQVIKESPALDSILVQDTSDHHTTVSSMGKVSAGFASLFAFLPPLAAEDDDNYLESGGSASCTTSKPHSTEDSVAQLEPQPVDNTHQKSPWFTKIIEPNAFVSHSPAEICTSEEKKTDVEPTCQGDSSSDSGSKKTVPQQRRPRFPKVKPKVRVPTRTARSKIQLTEDTNKQSESSSSVSSEKQPVDHLTTPQSISNTVDHRPESHGAAKPEMLLEKSDTDPEMIAESFWVVEEPFTVTGNTPETQKSDKVTSGEPQIKDTTPYDGNATDMDSASHLQSMAEQTSPQRRDRFTKPVDNTHQKSPLLSKIIEPNAFQLDSAVSHSPAEICTSEEKKTDVEVEPTCQGDSSSDSGSKTVPQQRRTRFPKVKPKVQVPTRTTRSRIPLTEDTNKQSEKESMDSSLNVSSEKQPIEHLTPPQSSSKTVDHRPESPGAAKSEMFLEKSDSDLEMITESFWVVEEPFTVTGNTLETQKSDKVTSEEPQIKDCTPDERNATELLSASHLQSMAEQTSPQRRDRFTKPVDNTHQKSPPLSKIIEPNAFQLDSAVSHSPAEICTSEEKKTDVELEPTCKGDSSSDSGSKTVPQQRRTRFPKVKPNVRVPTRTTRSRIPLTEETNNQSEKESGDSPSNVSSEKQSIEHLTPQQSSSNTVDHRPESHGAAKSEMLLEKSDSDLEMITESFWVVEEPFTVTGNTPETQKSDKVTSEEPQIKDCTPDERNATEMVSASHLQSVAEQHSSQRRSRCTKVKPNLRQATRVTRSKLPVETLTCSESDRLVTGTEIQPTQDLDLHSDVQILEDSSKSTTSQQSRSIPECSIKEPDALPAMPSPPMESNSLTANVLTADDVIMSETSWIIENPFEGTDYVPETQITDMPTSKHLPTEKPPTSQQTTVPSSKHLLTEEPSTSQLKIKREVSPKRGGRATRARKGKVPVIEPQPTEDAATTEMAPAEEADTREENKVEELQPFPQKETVSKRTRRSHPTTKDETSVKTRRGSRATRSKPQPVETICAGSEPETVNKASLPTVGSKPTPTKQADGAIMLSSPPRSTQHSELQSPVSYVEDVTKSQNVTLPASSKLTGEIGGEIMTSPEYTIDSEIAWLIEDPFSVSNTEAIELSTKPAASSTSLVTETGSVPQSGFNPRPATEAKEQTPQARTDAVTTSELQSSAEDASTQSKLERGQTMSASSKRQPTKITPDPHPWTDIADVILVSDSDQDIRDQTVLEESLSENRTSEPTTKESLQDLQNVDDASTGTCEREETSSKAPHPRRARLPKPKPCLGNSSRRTRMQSVQHPTQQTPAASSSGEKVGVSHGAVETLEDSEPCPDNRPPVEGATVEEHKHCGPSSDPISSPARPVIKAVCSLASGPSLHAVSSPSRPVITAVCSLASLFQTAPVMSVQDSVASHSGSVQSYPAVTTHPEGPLEQVPSDNEEPFFILSLTEVPVASTQGDMLLPYLPDSPAQQLQSSGLPSSGEGGHGLTLCVTGETGPDGNVTRVQDVDPRPTACASSVVQNSENAEGEPEPEPTCPPAQPQTMEPTAESHVEVEKQDAGDACDRSAAAELPPDTTSSTLKRPGRKPKGFLSFLSNKSSASPSRPARALSQAPQLGSSRTGRRRAAPTTTTASATTSHVDQKPSTSAAPLDATQRAGRDFKQSCHNPDSQPSTSQHPDPEPSTSKCPEPSTSQRAGAADRTANVSLHTQPSAPLQLMSAVDRSHPMLEEHHDFVEDFEEPTGVTQFFLNDIFTDMDEQ